MVCNENEIIHSFDLTQASVHDVKYLKDVKYNLNNCDLVGNKGYINADYQTVLFTHSKINLSVPMQTNQLRQNEFSKVKQRKRKRIETLLSKLQGQFSFNINFAKTLEKLITRVIEEGTNDSSRRQY